MDTLIIPQDATKAIAARKSSKIDLIADPGQLQVSTNDQNVITAVDADGLGFKLGLKNGWRLLAIGGVYVDAEHTVAKAVAKQTAPYVLTAVDQTPKTAKSATPAQPELTEAGAAAVRVVLGAALLAGSAVADAKEWKTAAVAAYEGGGVAKADLKDAWRTVLTQLPIDVREAALHGQAKGDSALGDVALLLHAGLGKLLGLQTAVPSKFRPGAGFVDFYVGQKLYCNYKGKVRNESPFFLLFDFIQFQFFMAL
jgi:nitrogen fixation protein